MTNPPICFVDCETTGLNRWLRRVWEVAIIRREPDGSEKECTFFVSDIDMSMADPFSLDVGKFYDRHPLYSPKQKHSGPQAPSLPESEVALQVERWTRGAHIIGAVPSFDEDCLANMLMRHKLLWAGHYHLIDVEALAVGYLKGLNVAKGGGFPEATLPWKSDPLSLLLGVDPPTDEERHTALGDAQWSKRLYDKIMN